LTSVAAARIVRTPEERGNPMRTHAAAVGTPVPVPLARARAGTAPRAVAIAVLLLYLAGVAVQVALGLRLHTLGDNPGEGLVIWSGFAFFAALGALLVDRRPGNAVGWIMSGAAALVALAPAGDAYAAYAMTVLGRPDPLAVLGAWVQSWYWLLLLSLVSVALPLFFPDGRLPSRRWLIPALVPLVGMATAVVLGMLTGTLTGQDVDYRIANPIGISGFAPVEDQPAFPFLGGTLGFGVMLGIAAVVVRFRRSRGAERQQMKWFLYAVAPLLLTPLEALLPPLVGSFVFAWMLIAFPLAIAIAVLRYRLDGIDVVINRTLVYAALTAVVVGVYVFVVGYLGAAFASDGDLTISLIATGVVAVLFAPLRDRLQRGVDRLFYGRRSEPYVALSQLGERLEGTLAPDAVLPTLASTVREALRLPYAAITLAEDVDTVSSGVAGPATVTMPLLHHGVPMGDLVLGLRPGESAFSAADRRLLADLARQAGVAVSAVRLTADLQRSRERLVTTREEERRRLRRDLHDGLGAQLAGLTVQTGVLKGLIGRDPEAAEALVGELRTELRAAIADIRRLVYELRPPALDELGLPGALQRLAERTGADAEGPRVIVDVPPDLPQLSAAAEVAVYRIAQEALTNVVRHACARTCLVRVTADDHAVMLEVIDDGRGVTSVQGSAGVGLASMRERAAEMGGECRVEPGPDGGTWVVARLPRAGGA
jgi:signal transduction histidine kinase